MAGLFGFFNFEKPGKGVDKPEKEQTGLALFFTVFFRKFWKMILLNLLYLLFCIPVVTIGPATAAMTAVLKAYSEKRFVLLWTDFWQQFKLNFKQTFFFGILDLVIVFILVYTWLILPKEVLVQLPGYMTFFKYFMLIPFVIYVMMRFYMYTIAVSYESTFFKIIMNSFLLALVAIYKNLYILLLCVVLFAIHFYSVVGLFTLPFYGFSMFGLLIVVYAAPVIDKYSVPDEDTVIEEDEKMS